MDAESHFLMTFDWTVPRDLSHRLEESTAILERYFLKSASYPQSMVITKSSHLLYLDKPKYMEKKVNTAVLWCTSKSIYKIRSSNFG